MPINDARPHHRASWHGGQTTVKDEPKRSSVVFSPEVQSKAEGPPVARHRRSEGSVGFSPEIHNEMEQLLKERRKTIEAAELEEAAAELAANNPGWGEHRESWNEDEEEEEDEELEEEEETGEELAVQLEKQDSNEVAIMLDPGVDSYFKPTKIQRETKCLGEWGCYIGDHDQVFPKSFLDGDTLETSPRGRDWKWKEEQASERPKARSESPTKRRAVIDSRDMPSSPRRQRRSAGRDSSPGRNALATMAASRKHQEQFRLLDYSRQVQSSSASSRSWFHADSTSERRSLDEDNQFAAIHFARWATGRWDKFNDLFTIDTRVANVLKRSEVAEPEFVVFCRRCGFDGDARRVFRQIAGESTGYAILDSSNSETKAIRLPQFLQFKRHAMALAAPVVENDVEGFVTSLRREGGLLRTWRVDFDRHGKGYVTFEDFGHACRKLGITGNQARNVWSTLRTDRDTAPLKLSDLAPEEANNLEHFTETLWQRFGFDLHKAWAEMDPKKRGTVSVEEFARGARHMGFDGNARLIFRGLDATALGRLRRADFDYLRAFLPSGLSAISALTHAKPAIRELGAWVQEALGTPEVCVLKLGLSVASNPGSKREITISVKDFATALDRLGYPGDPLEAAVAVARSGDGAQISGSMLMNILTGKPKIAREESETSGSPKSPATLSGSTSSSAPFRRALWNSGIDNFSDNNARRHKGGRAYFSMPNERTGSPTTTTSPSSPRSDLAENKAVVRHKAQWNDSVTDFALHGEKNTKYTKKYFSVPHRAQKAEKGCESPSAASSGTPHRRRPGSDSFCELPNSLVPSFATPVRRRPGRDSLSEISAADIPSVPASAGQKVRRRPGGDSFSEEMLENLPTTLALVAHGDGGSPGSGGSPPRSPSRVTTSQQRSPRSQAGAAARSSVSAPSRKAMPLAGSPFSPSARKYNAPSLAAYKRRTQPGEDSSEEA